MGLQSCPTLRQGKWTSKMENWSVIRCKVSPRRGVAFDNGAVFNWSRVLRTQLRGISQPNLPVGEGMRTWVPKMGKRWGFRHLFQQQYSIFSRYYMLKGRWWAKSFIVINCDLYFISTFGCYFLNSGRQPSKMAHNSSWLLVFMLLCDLFSLSVGWI